MECMYICIYMADSFIQLHKERDAALTTLSVNVTLTSSHTKCKLFQKLFYVRINDQTLSNNWHLFDGNLKPNENIRPTGIWPKINLINNLIEFDEHKKNYSERCIKTLSLVSPYWFHILSILFSNTEETV